MLSSTVEFECGDPHQPCRAQALCNGRPNYGHSPPLLVARSLERVWEDKLRAVEMIEQEYARWRSAEPIVMGEAERAALQRLGENLPQIWRAATTSAADRKRILLFIVHEVGLDQKRQRGQVWLKIVWQTGAVSEHHLQRRVHTYRDYIDVDRLRQRITELNAIGKMDKEIAATLNQEGFIAARGCAFKGENVWLLRQRRTFPPSRSTVSATTRFAGPTAASRSRASRRCWASPPRRCFPILARGLLTGHQLTKGQPWQVELTEEQVQRLRTRLRHPSVQKRRHHERVGSGNILRQFAERLDWR